MRDLSQVRYADGPKRHLGISKRFLKFGFLAVVVLAAVFFAKSKLFVSRVGATGAALHEAPRGLTGVKLPGDLDIASGVTDLTSQTATLRDVKYGGVSVGTATRSFGGGTYILSVEATLPDPVNQKYAVWVVGGGTPRLIDYMVGSGTKWKLTLRDTDKFSSYPSIWITLERTHDQKPEEHVMEGTF